MKNTSNDTDLIVFRYLLLPLFLQRGNKFLTYFGIQCCQITVSNTFEAICSFRSPKLRNFLEFISGLQNLKIASKVRITDSDLTALNANIYEKFVDSLQE